MGEPGDDEEDAWMSTAYAEAVETTRQKVMAELKRRRRTRAERAQDRLSSEDRALLFLRIDAGLPFDELARLMSTRALSRAELESEAGRLERRCEELVTMLTGGSLSDT